MLSSELTSQFIGIGIYIHVFCINIYYFFRLKDFMNAVEAIHVLFNERFNVSSAFELLFDFHPLSAA